MIKISECTMSIRYVVATSVLAIVVISVSPDSAQAVTSSETVLNLSLRDLEARQDSEIGTLTDDIALKQDYVQAARKEVIWTFEAMKTAENTTGLEIAQAEWKAAFASLIAHRADLWELKRREVNVRTKSYNKFRKRILERLQNHDGNGDSAEGQEAATEAARIQAELRQFAADELQDLAQDQSMIANAGLPAHVQADLSNLFAARHRMLAEPGMELDPSIMERAAKVDETAPLRTVLNAIDAQMAALNVRFTAITALLDTNRHIASLLAQRIIQEGGGNLGSSRVHSTQDLFNDI